jgi:hypothetical protein
MRFKQNLEKSLSHSCSWPYSLPTSWLGVVLLSLSLLVSQYQRQSQASTQQLSQAMLNRFEGKALPNDTDIDELLAKLSHQQDTTVHVLGILRDVRNTDYELCRSAYKSPDILRGNGGTLIVLCGILILLEPGAHEDAEFLALELMNLRRSNPLRFDWLEPEVMKGFAVLLAKQNKRQLAEKALLSFRAYITHAAAAGHSIAIVESLKHVQDSPDLRELQCSVLSSINFGGAATRDNCKSTASQDVLRQSDELIRKFEQQIRGQLVGRLGKQFQSVEQVVCDLIVHDRKSHLSCLSFMLETAKLCQLTQVSERFVQLEGMLVCSEKSLTSIIMLMIEIATAAKS